MPPARLASVHFLSEMLNADVRVTPKHPNTLLAGNGRHLHHAEPFFEQPTCRFMPQVVKSKSFDTFANTGPVKCLRDAGWLNAEHWAFRGSTQARNLRQGAFRQKDIPGQTVL
jgi:hypothetical protein